MSTYSERRRSWNSKIWRINYPTSVKTRRKWPPTISNPLQIQKYSPIFTSSSKIQTHSHPLKFPSRYRLTISRNVLLLHPTNPRKQALTLLLKYSKTSCSTSRRKWSQFCLFWPRRHWKQLLLRYKSRNNCSKWPDTSQPMSSGWRSRSSTSRRTSNRRWEWWGRRINS